MQKLVSDFEPALAPASPRHGQVPVCYGTDADEYADWLPALRAQ